MIDSLAKDIKKFTSSRNWAQFHSPKNLSIAISIEASELAEIFLWKETKESELDNLTPKELLRAREEIGDIQIYFTMICDRLKIDPLEAARDKIKLNQKKYSIEKAKNNSKKYTDL